MPAFEITAEHLQPVAGQATKIAMPIADFRSRIGNQCHASREDVWPSVLLWERDGGLPDETKGFKVAVESECFSQRVALHQNEAGAVGKGESLIGVFAKDLQAFINDRWINPECRHKALPLGLLVKIAELDSLYVTVVIPNPSDGLIEDKVGGEKPDGVFEEGRVAAQPSLVEHVRSHGN